MVQSDKIKEMRKTIKEYDELHDKENKMRIFKHKIESEITFNGFTLYLKHYAESEKDASKILLPNNKEFAHSLRKLIQDNHKNLTNKISVAEQQILICF